jgi:hypothetical protein
MIDHFYILSAEFENFKLKFGETEQNKIIKSYLFWVKNRRIREEPVYWDNDEKRNHNNKKKSV